MAVDPASPVLLLYTAAFTGRPSGALLSHTALLTEGLVVAMLQGITEGYVYLNSGPLFHAATLMSTIATFAVGGTNVFTPGPTPRSCAGSSTTSAATARS